MRNKLLSISSIVLSLFFLLAPAALALDYNNWISLLPDSISGVAKSGEPQGMNMQSGQNEWSSLQQAYSDDPRDIQVTIVSGATAPQVQTFENMPEFNMEDDEKIVKSTQASGHRAFLELSKTDGTGQLIVSAGERTIVIIEADPAEGEDTMTSIAAEIPISDIGAKTE